MKDLEGPLPGFIIGKGAEISAQSPTLVVPVGAQGPQRSMDNSEHLSPLSPAICLSLCLGDSGELGPGWRQQGLPTLDWVTWGGSGHRLV